MRHHQAMSALTDDQLAYLHAELGGSADEADMQVRYTRLGSVVAVAEETIRERLADLLAKPASVTLTGVMSKDTSANIRALQPQALRLAAELRAEQAVADSGIPLNSGRLLRPDRAR